MSPKKEKPSSPHDDTKRIRVSKNGPYIISGGIPLSKKEIRNDAEGYCSSWHEIETYPPAGTVCPVPLRAVEK